jgi:molybdopterin-containing oxidoreductase family membrane subunit
MEVFNDTMTRRLVAPVVEKRPGTILLAAVLSAATLYWLYWCARVVSGGHGLLATSSYGAVWGLTVANIVHIIGISHVGIAISATVRVLRLERYRSVARVAELVTVIALITAVINIALDVGRPDRFIVDTIVYGKWRAPMVWSMTVIALYFSASAVYLYLSVRRDMWLMSHRPGRNRWLYGLLARGYNGTREERERYERTLFWLAIALVPIMVSVHSVYGLFFGLLSSKAGWFNPLQAPYFVLGAVVSGFSAIIVVAALLRRAFDWQEVLTDRLFRVFGSFLAFVVFLYLYFLVSEHLTAQYFPGTAEKAVSDSLLFGRFATAFWLTVVGGLVLPFAYLFVQGVRDNAVKVGWTASAALLINAAMFFKRVLLVVPSQYQAHLPLPREPALYSPSHAEIVVALGSYAFAALLFIGLLKVLPVVELPVTADAEPATVPRKRSAIRRAAMIVSLLAGVSMIAWGIAAREADFAPLKWLVGLLLLVAIPLESCLIANQYAGGSTEKQKTRERVT